MSTWTKLIVGAAVALLVVATVTAPEDIEPGSVAVPPVSVPDSRPFAMGFTSWPYDFSATAEDETYNLIAEHADLITFHLDHGVPWPEALSGEPFPAGVETILDRMAEEAERFPLVYVSATPQLNDRRTIAGYWDGDPQPLPPDWEGRSLDDPEVVEAYINYARRVIDQIEPDYFAYGIEVNANLSRTDPEYAAYKDHVAQVYATLKADYPDLPIFLTFQIGSFEVSLDEQEAVTRELLVYSDLLGVSIYPYLAGGLFTPERADMAYLPDDLFSRFAALAPDKGFAITETGYIAENLNLDTLGFHIQGREEWQAMYTAYLLERLEELDAEFVVWWEIRDYDAGYRLMDSLRIASDVFLIWRDIGLIDGAGRPRAGLETWDAWLERPLVRP